MPRHPLAILTIATCALALAAPKYDPAKDDAWVAPRKNWWAFQKVQRPAPPPIKDVRNPVDAFLLAAMRAKAEQNPEVKRILVATGDLILKPDHHGEVEPPPEWKYYEIWMQIRSELHKNTK